jgi:membrane-bound lytic murein transglycosylase B
MEDRSASWDYLRRGWVVTLTAVTVAVAALIPAGRAGAAVAATSRAAPSGLAAIPAAYLTWYKEAARTCHGLAWEVLAAIGTMESDNGRSAARGVHHGKNRKGAEGPMQFEPATFAEYAVRADRSHKLSPYDPEDAIFSAARMLCSDGGGRARGLKGAIFAYNHARWYVRDVLAVAARYTAAAAARHHRPRPARPRHHARHR